MCASPICSESASSTSASRASADAVFKTPWPGDPRVNIQESKGKAKPYQVRQVLLAIDKMDAMESRATGEGQ